MFLSAKDLRLTAKAIGIEDVNSIFRLLLYSSYKTPKRDDVDGQAQFRK